MLDYIKECTIAIIFCLGMFIFLSFSTVFVLFLINIFKGAL